jgi:histidinol-phosphate aminotransferase
MTVSRRDFVRTIGVSGIGAVALAQILARGREGLAEAAETKAAAASGATSAAPAVSRIRLDSNENPNGPAPAALEAMRGAFGETNRYPDDPATDLRSAIAARHGVAAENVVIGCGSTEILRASAYAFTSKENGLVTAAPSFEAPARFTDVAGGSVAAVPVTEGLRLDLDAMAAKAPGAGLVYLCNPNNPTASHHSAAMVKEFIGRVAHDAPQTTVLVDEAYFDYVADPAYATAIPLAISSPRVVVARTFSKIFGLAGMRVGYAVAHQETISRMKRHVLFDSVNGLGAAAAIASLKLADHVEAQRRLNSGARELARSFFETAGYHVYPSETNFMMVDVRRDSRAFRDACRSLGVSIGRPFPPLTTCARISIGTMEEMRAACDLFRRALA